MGAHARNVSRERGGRVADEVCGQIRERERLRVRVRVRVRG